MKFSLSTSIVAAILGLALVSIPVTAQAATNTTAAAAPAKPAKAKNPQFHGSLTAVDATAGTISVDISTKKAPGTSLDLVVAPTSTVKKDGKKATLADYKVGDKIGGSYVADAAGKNTVVNVTVTSTKEKAAPKTAPKAAPATK